MIKVDKRKNQTMERGILWLTLLAAFIWLAWQGRNEYQKWKLIATGHSS